MSASVDVSRRVKKRKASDVLEASDCGNGQSLSDDLDFLAPHHRFDAATDLLFCLTTKRLINLPFSTLHERSTVHGWSSLLTRERRNLKANVNSLEKCFMLNRLIAETTKDGEAFAQRSNRLHEELLACMSNNMVAYASAQDLYMTILVYQDLLRDQRLFFIDRDDPRQVNRFPGLQRATTELCVQFVQNEQRNQLRELLQHAFLIVTEPASSECVVATKYEKIGKSYVAKLNTRIVCLVDADQVDSSFTLSPIAVTLCAFDRHADEDGETQAALEWKTRRVCDSSGSSKRVYYAELQTIDLIKSDARTSRPFHSSKLCQLKFRLTINVRQFSMEVNVTFLSRPFGICSHAQYFPEYVAKILIYELEQRAVNKDALIEPSKITNAICRYHTRIAGVKPKAHTIHFILQECQARYSSLNVGLRKRRRDVRSNGVYEDLLAKLISQIEFYVDHPVLSMMYDDNLFLGICDSNVDEHIRGTADELQILLRFNTLAEHQSTQQAAVRYIVHNGRLIKATFHQKTFVDELCRMICESNSAKAKRSRIVCDGFSRYFHDFSLYFDEELYRLSTVVSLVEDVYQPLVPVLWSTMRSTMDGEPTPQQDRSSTAEKKLAISAAAISQIRTGNSAMHSDDKVAREADELIDFLSEELIRICATSHDSSTISSAHSAIEQHRRLLSTFLHEHLQKIALARRSTDGADEMKKME